MKKLVLILSAVAVSCFAQMSFDKVEVRTAFGKADSGNSGYLTVDARKIVFSKKKGGAQGYFSIPTAAVKELFYSRVAGRRIGAAIIVSPLLLFSKGRKHYLTISFNDGADLAGAVEFKLDKGNYRGILRSTEEVTGLTMRYDQEGVKETEQTVATRGERPVPPARDFEPSLAPVTGKTVRAFITDSDSWSMAGDFSRDGGTVRGGARPQTVEVIRTFSEQCASVTVTMNPENADYIVRLDHEGGKGIARKDNKVAVFNKAGDLIHSDSTRSLGNAIKGACLAIERGT